jgi:hypothetical protein
MIFIMLICEDVRGAPEGGIPAGLGVMGGGKEPGGIGIGANGGLVVGGGNGILKGGRGTL